MYSTATVKSCLLSGRNFHDTNDSMNTISMDIAGCSMNTVLTIEIYLVKSIWF